MEKGDFQKAAETYMSVVSMGRGFDPEGWGIAHRTSVMHIVTGRLVKLINTIPDKDNAVKDIFEEMKRIKSDFPDLKACLVLNNYLAQQTVKNYWAGMKSEVGKKAQVHLQLMLRLRESSGLLILLLKISRALQNCLAMKGLKGWIPLKAMVNQ